MKLYLVQHGDAVSKGIDPNRPLSETGQSDVRSMAVFLGAAGIHVQTILHSGKTRAEQTAIMLAEGMRLDTTVEAIAGVAPNDSVDEFARTLVSQNQDTMVVGHLPFMARLAALLLAGDAEQDLVAYRPGSVACLERLESGAWHLNWMMRPELLQRD
jgi:phosphohistidine phosphatase